VGLFSKKPSPGEEVFNEYADAMRPWMERLQKERESGSEITTVGDAVNAAGDVPSLGLQRLTGSAERDRAFYAARAWINMEAERLSRRDLLRGGESGFWQSMADELWAARDHGIRQ
jgi:hypothetical protein